MSRAYEVGYGKPPKHTRFKKGQSGNPNGRKKGTRNLMTELSEELEEQVMIREGGTQKRVSKMRAMIKTLTARVAQGDVKAWTPLMQLMDRLPPEKLESEETEELGEDDCAILAAFEARIRAAQEQEHGPPADSQDKDADPS